VGMDVEGFDGMGVEEGGREGGREAGREGGREGDCRKWTRNRKVEEERT